MKNIFEIKFSSDDHLFLKKALKLHDITTVVRFVFNEGNKFYPQVFLDGIYTS